MTTPEESTGVSRRDMLKRSAMVGGTLLWVTPTVSVLSATAAAAGSHPSPGDGSQLDASYYILSITCGTTHYLVKIDSGRNDGDGDASSTAPFVIETGPRVRGNANDPNDGVPANNPSKPQDTAGITKDHVWATKVAGPPPDVVFYTTQGRLCIDLNKDNVGPACTLDNWIAHNGQLYFKKGVMDAQYGPTQPEGGDPSLLCFPLLPNKDDKKKT